MKYAKGSFSGNYLPNGDISEADCVIGQEFGYRADEPGLSNEALAAYIAENFAELPLILNHRIAEAIKKLNPNLNIIAELEGYTSDITNSADAGTYGELKLAKTVMNQNGLERPILAAHAYHVGRSALQAGLLGIEPIVPEGLPKAFDKQSEQIWTRGPAGWTVRELVGVHYLKKQRQL